MTRRNFLGVFAAIPAAMVKAEPKLYECGWLELEQRDWYLRLMAVDRQVEFTSQEFVRMTTFPNGRIKWETITDSDEVRRLDREYGFHK